MEEEAFKRFLSSQSEECLNAFNEAQEVPFPAISEAFLGAKKLLEMIHANR